MKASVKIHRTALDTHINLFIALSTKETHELAEEVAQLETGLETERQKHLDTSNWAKEQQDRADKAETVTKQLRDDLRGSTSISVQLGIKLEKHEAAIVVLRTYLDKHKHHPHTPVLSGGNGGGTVKCACFGCNLARQALAALRSKNEESTS